MQRPDLMSAQIGFSGPAWVLALILFVSPQRFMLQREQIGASGPALMLVLVFMVSP